MDTGIEHDLRQISVKIIKILRWIQTSNRFNIQQLPEILTSLVEFIKEMYAKGGDELQPGGLCALTTLQNSAVCNDVTLDRQHQLGNEVIEGTLKCFTENWRGPLLVTLNVEICRSHLNGLSEVANKAETTKICKKVLDTVGFIVNHYSSPSHCKNQAKTSTILLCLNQIKNCLPLFLVGFEEDCCMVQKYASNCLMECLDRIQKESCEATVLSCSEFIDLMDSALNLLDDLIENTREWMANFQERIQKLKEIIDELLCHSMSTAQVAATDDDKETILSKSQKILHSMETLKDDLAGEDMSSVILAAHTVSDALCALERAVNSAVLRLVLQVNSGLDDPLRELVDMSRPGVELSKASRKASDLDDGTAKFDAYMDKLMQIGTFAVSCSSNIKKAMQLRSCLASFESLEAELIPCVTAVYLDPSRSNKRNLRIFVEHWIKECQKFRSVLDTIVDPAAFVDVVRDSLNIYFAQLETSNDCASVLSNMIKISKTLSGILETSIHQDCAENVSEMTLLARKVTQGIENCERVCYKLRAPDANVPVNDITKRAQTLIETVDKVLDYFARHIAESDSINLDVSADSFVNRKVILPTQKNYYQLCPTDCETPSDTLKPLMAKGKLMMKEAILYNTPRRSTVKRPERATPVVPSTVRKSRLASVARSRCFRSTARAKEQELTDMELTALLEDLSKLDCTFSLNETLKPRKDEEFHGRKLLDLFTGWDSLLEQTPECELTENGASGAQPGSTIGSSDTPERFQDLLMVGEKIEQLRKLKPN